MRLSLLSFANDTYLYSSDQISGGRYAYNVAATFTPIAVGAKFGAIPGALVGAAFLAGDVLYQDLQNPNGTINTIG